MGYPTSSREFPWCSRSGLERMRRFDEHRVADGNPTVRAATERQDRLTQAALPLRCALGPVAPSHRAIRARFAPGRRRSRTPVPNSTTPNASFCCEVSSASQAHWAVRQQQADVGRGSSLPRPGGPSGTPIDSDTGIIGARATSTLLEERLATLPTLPSCGQKRCTRVSSTAPSPTPTTASRRHLSAKGQGRRSGAKPC